MKYKKLTKEQIIISLDRLTRFKKTKDKYLRVFSDILCSNLIEPKLKKQEIEGMDYAIISEYVSEIFNNSLEKNNELQDNSINKLLLEYENNLFINDAETQKLLDNSINYKGALHLIKENSPINLQWLKSLSGNYNKQQREKYLLKFPIEEVLLVEGITEEILLPAFSKFLGYDFYAKGIQIVAAGGKNQVVKMYYDLSEVIKVPIFILLDKDAQDNILQIEPKLRDKDKIHTVSCGEFEDLLPPSLIVKTVNTHFANFMNISQDDLNKSLPNAKILEEIFKTKGLHEFKKAEFAKLVRDQIKEESDISVEIKSIIDEIKSANKTLDTEICS